MSGRDLALRSDTVDVADVVRTVRRQWRAIAGFVALGVLAAVAVLLFAPRRYEGRSSVLARTSGAGGGSVLGRMTGGVGELMGGLGGLAGGSSIETELQMLRSRALAGQVVDSLRLQVRVHEPAGTPPEKLITAYRLDGRFAPRKYLFERAANGTYRVTGDSVARAAAPGQSVPLDAGSVTLAGAGLPERFEIRVYDREDAISRLSRRLTATKAGGEIARITFRGDDRTTAAAVPNALIHFYLERRKTVDRGSNQRRVEYVTQQVETTAAELQQAERELRRHQESTRVFDADVSDMAQQEAFSKLRESLIQLQVDEAALSALLAQADRGALTSRDLAAYPAFIQGSAVSPLATQLSELEITRTRLLERRTERDPEVIAIDRSMQAVSASIVGMARSYAQSVSRQRAEFQTRLDSLQRTLAGLPAANERVGRLRRDVLRLTQLYTALQAQLVEARLAAIGEGGEVRQIDVAAPPRGPVFPQPLLTMGLGTGGGLVAGLVAALFLSWFGRWLRDPVEIERVTGISAHRYQPDVPLLMAGGMSTRTVLVVPLDERAQLGRVAERLAHTAATRALPVQVVDFTGAGSSIGGNGTGHSLNPNDVARQIQQLEEQRAMLVVQLPPLASDATVAALHESRPVVLVAPPGPVDRALLTTALDTLRRMEVPCAGIVIGEPDRRRRPRLLA